MKISIALATKINKQITQSVFKGELYIEHFDVLVSPLVFAH